MQPATLQRSSRDASRGQKLFPNSQPKIFSCLSFSTSNKALASWLFDIFGFTVRFPIDFGKAKKMGPYYISFMIIYDATTFIHENRF